MDHEDNNVELNFMEQVEEKITLPRLKDRLLATSAWRSLSNEEMTTEQHRQVQDFFFSHCGNNEMKEELKISIDQKEKLKTGERLPDFSVVDSRGQTVMVNHLAENSISPTAAGFSGVIGRGEIINPPVSVCHQVSIIGQRFFPITS